MAKLLLVSFLLGAEAQAQDPGPVTQREIDQALRKGTEYLKTAPSTGGWLHANCDELILLTMIHAGVTESHAKFDQYLRNCLQSPLERTYKVACLAMALEELDAEKYQMKIAQCAAFLVDNQASNGQWSYGKPVDVKNYSFQEPKKKVASDAKTGDARDFGSGLKERKKPAKQIVVAQTKHEGEKGDNSNSYFAALGLLACYEANIKPPLECIHLARKWWVEAQFPDEGESGKAGKNSGGEPSKIRGWNYQKPGEFDGGGKPTHAMTAGAVGANAIYEYMSGNDFKKDTVTRAGINWLSSHFTVSANNFYLNALERAGILTGNEMFGGHEWYAEGAKQLVLAQNASGSWGRNERADENTWDTCFAILFLKRATHPLREPPPTEKKK